MTCVELADLEKCHRTTAWRIMVALQTRYGAKEVVLRDRKWRARTEVVAAYFKAKKATPDDRIAEIERRVNDLLGELEERDARLDQLAREFRELQDRLRVRRL